MALPRTIQVKLSSEAAESITLTRVVVQDLPVEELLDHILAIAGKNVSRIQEILLLGTLVTGASRYRWAGLKVEAGDVHQALQQFPDPDPSIVFARERCFLGLLRGSGRTVEIPREAAASKGFFTNATFWDALMTAAETARYSGYSYRERADLYVREFSVSEIRDLRASAQNLRFSVLRDRVQTTPFTRAEYLVKRG